MIWTARFGTRSAKVAANAGRVIFQGVAIVGKSSKILGKGESTMNIKRIGLLLGLVAVVGCSNRADEYQKAVEVFQAEKAELNRRLSLSEAEVATHEAESEEYKIETEVLFQSLKEENQRLRDTIESHNISAKEAFGALGHWDQEAIRKIAAKLHANEPISINSNSGAPLRNRDPFGFIKPFIKIGSPLHIKFKEALARQADAGGWWEITTPPKTKGE